MRYSNYQSDSGNCKGKPRWRLKVGSGVATWPEFCGIQSASRPLPLRNQTCPVTTGSVYPDAAPLPKRRHGKTSWMRSIIEWVLVAPTGRQVTSTKRRPLIFLIVSLKDEFNRFIQRRFLKVRCYFRGEIRRYFYKMWAVNADDQVTLLTPPVKVIWADAT